MAAKTRSVDPRLSEEVRWFLRTRGIPYPDCPPLHLTPDPSRSKSASFDPGRVDRVLNAFSRLRHTQGKWAGKQLKPDPWQIAYILAPVFGWVRKNDDGEWVRAIRSVFIDVPRKNGKTTLAGGIALYLTAADNEPGAQVYAVAAGKDQARYCFDPVKALAEKSPELRNYVKAHANRVVHPASGSYFAVVSSMADLLFGGNIHGAIIDELHIHKSDQLVKNVESGTGSRRQPLIITITTADDGTTGTIYDRRRLRIEQLASGVIHDPNTYGVIFAADPTADPFAESTWTTANPGLGISPTREFLASEATKAKQSPADLAAFLRLHLGVRTKLDKRYLPLEGWRASTVPLDERELLGRECFGGLDLASTSDLTALCWDFPGREGSHDVIWRCWIPEAGLESLDRRTQGEARVWVRRGWLQTTPGNVADYNFIRRQINEDRSRFRVREVAYDPWNSSQLVTDLAEDGLALVMVRQGYASMSGPTKELNRLLRSALDGEAVYRHADNPLVYWSVSNFAVAMDPAGNVKPDRASARDKIDPVVAAVMALDLAMRHGQDYDILESVF